MVQKFFKPTQSSIWFTLFICLMGSSIPSIIKIIQEIRARVCLIPLILTELNQILVGAILGYLILCVSCFLGRYLASRFQKN